MTLAMTLVIHPKIQEVPVKAHITVPSIDIYEQLIDIKVTVNNETNELVDIDLDGFHPKYFTDLRTDIEHYLNEAGFKNYDMKANGCWKFYYLENMDREKNLKIRLETLQLARDAGLDELIKITKSELKKLESVLN